jgi:hypothetical protein
MNENILVGVCGICLFILTIIGFIIPTNTIDRTIFIGLITTGMGIIVIYIGLNFGIRK